MSTAAIKTSARRGPSSLHVWSFALRNWLAIVLALYVAFWLQLDGASSAATCVAILSLQTRGEALQKAFYRLSGTAIGVMVSIVIAGTFDQTRYIFFIACCTWLALCVAMAGLLDGNRAYGAVLSGYTVAIVALPNIDTPTLTFMSGINQGAAIMIGVVAVAIVNDLTFTPNLFPSVVERLNAVHGRVISFAIDTLQTGTTPAQAASLFKDITALHSDMTALSAEALRGRVRFAAASLAAVAMLRTVSATHVVAASLEALGEEGNAPREDLLGALRGMPHEPVLQRALDVIATPSASPTSSIAASAFLVILEQDRTTREALDEMRRERPPVTVPSLALYRSRPVAVRNGMRAFLAVAVPAMILSWLNWPATTLVLVQIATLIGLSATNPSPKGFATAALIGVPLAIIAAGVTEFLVLDGVDQFELLALGMGPTIVICSFLLSSGKPAAYGIGFLLLVLFTVILSPTNPQLYNPQTYLIASFLSSVAVVVLYLALSSLLPTPTRRRRSWILASARLDLRDAMAGRRRFSPGATPCAFRDADRIRQFVDLEAASVNDDELRHLMRMSELAACARRIRLMLDTNRALQTLAARGNGALAMLDPGRLRSLGLSILLTSQGRFSPHHATERRAAIDILLAATLIEISPRIRRELVVRSAL